MKISVVIPLYNKAAHIKRAVDSVLSQTEQDFEIIVVDDGSSDSGGDIVKSYSDFRVKYVRQQNFGVSVARNNGIKQAQADIVGFLDADDEYKPKFLETILNLRNNYPQAGLYVTAYTLKEPNGKEIKPKYKALPQFPWEGLIPNYFESALGISPVCASAAAIPKQVFTVVGCFPEGESLGEDLDTWFRIALKYPISFSSYEGAVYHREVHNRACDSKASQEYLLVHTAKEAIRNRVVQEKDISFVNGIIDRQIIVSFANLIFAGKRAEAKIILAQLQGQFYTKDKLFWMFWAYMPYSFFKISLWIKQVITAKIFSSKNQSIRLWI